MVSAMRLPLRSFSKEHSREAWAGKINRGVIKLKEISKEWKRGTIIERHSRKDNVRKLTKHKDLAQNAR